ncbi:MAG: HU family DNA-binding protein [Sulfuricellaceae bacterium]
MTKQKLIGEIQNIAATLAGKTICKTDVETVINALVGKIQGELAAGEKVTVPGLGTFTVKSRAARTGRNPKTGASLDIPAKIVPHFSAATALKEAVGG